tara:strand:- start:762 stop:1064 length:303 start_codon:yes stop_codon:yes gene_type:complete
MNKLLEEEIIAWADDRDIFQQSTASLQFSKTLEEVLELYDGIIEGDVDEISDAIGDVMVTLIIQAQMWGLSATDCLTDVYKEISQRKGKMVNGKFVKEKK